MGEFYYREIVFDHQVGPEKVREANKVLKYCREVLNIPDLTIRWCVKVDKADYEKFGSGPLADTIRKKHGFEKDEGAFSGQSKFLGELDDRIWIRADIPFDQIGLTVAHECKHVHDFGKYGKYSPPRTQKEKEAADKPAEDFARSVMRKIGNK